MYDFCPWLLFLTWSLQLVCQCWTAGVKKLDVDPWQLLCPVPQSGSNYFVVTVYGSCKKKRCREQRNIYLLYDIWCRIRVPRFIHPVLPTVSILTHPDHRLQQATAVGSMCYLLTLTESEAMWNELTAKDKKMMTTAIIDLVTATTLFVVVVALYYYGRLM